MNLSKLHYKRSCYLEDAGYGAYWFLALMFCGLLSCSTAWSQAKPGITGLISLGPKYTSTTPGVLNGLVSGFQISAGSGYNSEPTVTISGGSGTGATATAMISGVTKLNLAAPNFGGAGYTSVPAVTISGGGGSGATAIATTANHVVTSLTLIDGGTGYTSAPTVTFSGGSCTPCATATATINLGEVTGIALGTGTGYTSAPTVMIAPPAGGGTTATATATIFGGMVTRITMTNNGTGYTSVPTVAFSGGGGSGATATATISSGFVTGFAPLGAGTGYTTPPAVTLSGGGCLTCATATAIIYLSRPDNDFEEVFAHPNVYSAVDINVTWLQLEPNQGHFRFGAIDRALATIAAYNATHTRQLAARLRLAAGVSSPAWLLNNPSTSVQIDINPISTGGGDGNSNACPQALEAAPINPGALPTSPVTDPTFPMGRFWSADHTSKWKDLQNALAAVYDTNPLIQEVAVSSCSSKTSEPFNLPLDKGSLYNMIVAGYTDAQMMTCLSSAADTYSAWVNTPLEYTFNPYRNAYGVSEEAFTKGVIDGWNTTGTAHNILAHHANVDSCSAVAHIASGTGYTSAPTVTISGGGGSGATATAIIGGISSLAVTAPGAGYTSAPTVTISGGGGSGATATASFGGITQLTLMTGGTGYTAVPTVTIGLPPFGGLRAKAAATIVSGSVQGLTITYPGSGYTGPPTVTIAPPGGGGVTATASVGSGDWGSVPDITLTNSGTGYTSAPIVTISGSGSGATASATFGGITGLSIVNSGTGYTFTPSVTFSGGGGSGAAATATINAGSVNALNLSSGSGPHAQQLYIYKEFADLQASINVPLSLQNVSFGNLTTIQSDYPSTLNYGINGISGSTPSAPPVRAKAIELWGSTLATYNNGAKGNAPYSCADLTEWAFQLTGSTDGC